MAKIRNDCLPLDVLESLLAYDPVNGILTWKPRPASMFAPGKHSAEHTAAKWNARYAGKAAFTAREPYGYGHGDILGKRYKAHRVAWALYHGEWPQGFIDHINGDASDNKIGNLRVVTAADNMKNQKKNSANKSGFCGVSWSNLRGKWSAQIKVAGRKYHLGLFRDINEAVAARKGAEAKFGFHPNHGLTAEARLAQ